MLISVVVVAGGVWLLAFVIDDREAKYDGNTVSEWATNLHSADAALANAARAAITNRVIPAICAQMFNDTNDSQFRLNLAEKLNQVPGVNIYAMDNQGRRANAAKSLGEFGPEASSAIPDLLKLANGGDLGIRIGAIDALGEIHSAPSTVVPVLAGFLDSGEEELEIASAEALEKFGPVAKPAVPKLIPLLTAHSKELPYVSRKAIEAIDPSALSTNKSR